LTENDPIFLISSYSPATTPNNLSIA